MDEAIIKQRVAWRAHTHREDICRLVFIKRYEFALVY